MKKKLFFLLGILIFADIIYFSYTNRGLSVDYNYKPLIESFQFDNGIMMLFMSLYAALGTYLLIYYKMAQKDEKLKKYSKTMEKTSLESEDSSDRIMVLEEKIKTLESALKNILENKD
ncbi:MAG: hypothetical protein WC197_09115 [Candidatus Gastranaerophilaceae bacterium]|jgi:hypothetical protein